MIAEKSGLLWQRRRTRMSQLAPTTAARALVAGELAAGEGGAVSACVGVSVDAPAALGRLGDQHPGALGERRIAGCASHDVGQLAYDPKLLVAVQDADRREYLHPHVVTVAGGVGQRVGGQLVDERG